MNAEKMEDRNCYNCKFVKIISKDLGEVLCTWFGKNGLYRNAILKMDDKRNCHNWKLREELK